MKNTMSFLSVLFLILFTGRLGKFGELSTVSWGFVFMPLVIDFIYNLLQEVNKKWGLINWIITEIDRAIIKKRIALAAKKARNQAK